MYTVCVPILITIYALKGMFSPCSIFGLHKRAIIVFRKSISHVDKKVYSCVLPFWYFLVHVPHLMYPPYTHHTAHHHTAHHHTAHPSHCTPSHCTPITLHTHHTAHPAHCTPLHNHTHCTFSMDWKVSHNSTIFGLWMSMYLERPLS